MNTLKRLSFFFGSMLLVTACTTKQPTQQLDRADWQAQRQKLESVTQWTLSGKLAIITPQKKGSARIRWQQQGDNYNLNLTSILGTRIMDMQKTGPIVTIIDDKGRSYTGNDAELLVYRLTGWQMPLTHLPEWLKGLPKETQFDLNAQGQVTQIRANDWAMHYTSYQDVNGLMLPQDVTFQGPSTRLHLLINEWDLQ